MKRLRRIAYLAMTLSVISFLFVGWGLIQQVFNLPGRRDIAGKGFLCFGIPALIVLVKFFPDLMEYDCLKLEKKYNGKKLFRLSSMDKNNVIEKLKLQGFTWEGGYYRKKKYSLAKDSITYYVRLVDCKEIERTFEEEWKRFSFAEKSKGCRCLILLFYLDHMSREDRKSIKEMGKSEIIIECAVNPKRIQTSLLVAVDNETKKGYFLDIEGHRISIYYHGCKMIKALFKEPGV